MQPTQDNFPVFEANQVLTSGHLNDIFNYLDEQERLTRANLIGIGIVCGLEIKLVSGSSTTIELSKGCGTGSQGYLIVEAEDVSLVSYRANYLLPADLDYPTLKDAKTNTQYPLWELFPKGEPNTTLLDSTSGFLDDKAVLLFLELKKQGLRNCSPNNCDDKGTEVTASVKRLLVKRDDLTKIITAANAPGNGLTSNDLESALLAHLDLPDIRLPRFDVRNTNPAMSNDILGAFLAIFRANKLAQATAGALSAAYAAFKPLLQDAYPADPFGDFKTKFGFLDQAPSTTVQVLFLQYYYDFFDDLLQAYDEFRWKGAELVCACCPPEGLFPRHLMLGLLYPEKVGQPGIYRQGFFASPAIGACSERSKELTQLFRRLVEMATRFTNKPGLPQANNSAGTDPQIRITPSILGNKPLSDKAIPYYYQQNGTPPLYQLWSRDKTRRNRANQNLGYRFDEYTPTAPPFVSNPLRYDLEPYNFLRIEGHLGKNYQRVLGSLLRLKTQYRLPIEVVALRSGVHDDTQAVDLSKESARFQDLEALYDVLRAELLSSLAEGVMYLYGIAVENSTLPGGTPQHPLLKTHAPNYRYPAGSVGAWYEKYLTLFQSRPYIDVDQNHVDSTAVLTVYCTLFTGTADLPNTKYPHAVSIYYFTKLSEILPAALDALAYADFENKYQDLLGLVRYFRSDAVSHIAKNFQAFIPQEDLIDHFDQVLFSCKLDPIRSIHDEHVRRIRELRQKQFLGHFLQAHPGIQHKAGAPLGGTLILVYHQDPAPSLGIADIVGLNAAILSEALASSKALASGNSTTLTMDKAAVSETASVTSQANPGLAKDAQTAARIDTPALIDAITRIGSNQSLALNPDISLLLGSLMGQISIPNVNLPPLGLGEQASKIIATAVNALADGTVIADFFLPYLISSDYAAVQFVLPKIPPTFSVMTGCPNSDGFAQVSVTPEGGLPPYDINIDGQGYQPLGETLFLGTGTHTLTIRDVESAESASQTVTLAPPITFGEPVLQCGEDFSSYTATFQINGGTPPYSIDGVPIDGNTHTTASIASGTGASIEVADSNQCSAKMAVAHTCVKPCDLPCSGIALRRGYRFWLPEPDANKPYKSFKIEKLAFSFEFTQGSRVDLSANVQAIIQSATADDLTARFAEVVGKWLEQINKLIAEKTGKADWLKLAYQPALPGSLGTLWIEHFECLKFDIQIISYFQRPEVTEGLSLAYSPEGTTAQSLGQVKGEIIKIPAFDGVKIDKCNPQNPDATLCAKIPDLKLKIGKQVDKLTAVVNVSPSGGDEPSTYLWEAQDGNPAMANGQQAKFTFTSTDPKTKLILVTAFTKDGCRVIQEDQIDLLGRG